MTPIVPGPPLDITTVSTESTRVALKWNEPVGPSGNINFYHVCSGFPSLASIMFYLFIYLHIWLKTFLKYNKSKTLHK